MPQRAVASPARRSRRLKHGIRSRAHPTGTAVGISLPLTLGHALNVDRAQPLVGFFDFKFDPIAFFQVLVGDLAVVEKNVVFSFVGFRESVSFSRTEPLNGSLHHNSG